MSDLISRSALLESLMHCDALGRKSFEAVMEIIKEQPTAPERGGGIHERLKGCSTCLQAIDFFWILPQGTTR